MGQSVASLAFCLAGLSCMFSVTAGGSYEEEAYELCTAMSGWFGKLGWWKRNREWPLFGNCKATENTAKKSNYIENLAPRYDAEVSLKMMLFSLAAYSGSHQQECLINALPSSNVEIKTYVAKECDMCDGKCAGFLAVSHTEKAVVISFRGSQGVGQSLRIFLSSISTPTEEFLGGRVQSYWKRAFDDLWEDMESKFRELRTRFPRYKVWITGHSLGGTIASLTSAWLSYNKIVPREDITLYTFGSPRVGNYDYALRHDELVNNSFRVVNYNDLVPHFPTLNLNNISDGPYHSGLEVYYTKPASSVDSPHKECRGKPANEDKCCSFSTRFPYSIEQHLDYLGIPLVPFLDRRCALR